MRVLTISTHDLELVRTHLSSPSVLIGRSPVCDVVLRSHDVMPVHYLLEWIGTGKFDPEEGSWSLFDLTQSSEETTESSEANSTSTMGIFFDGDKTLSIEGFNFNFLDDPLYEAPLAGTAIKNVLDESKARAAKDQIPLSQSLNRQVIEIVKVNKESNSVDDVLHIDSNEMVQPFKKIPVRLQWSKEQEKTAIVDIQQLPKATVFNRGLELDPSGTVSINTSDFLQIRSDLYEFYVRLVEKIDRPTIKRSIFNNPLVPLALLFVLGAIFALKFFVSTDLVSKENEPPPKRIARIEIKKIIEPPPVAPIEQPVEKPSLKEQPLPKKVEKPQPKKPEVKNVVKKASKKSASVSFKRPTPKKEKPAPGLNSPAPKKNVNKMGILSALSKSKKSPNKVDADMIMNKAIVSETVSGKSADFKIKQPPTGQIDMSKNKTGGNPDGSNDLDSASTTLSDPKYATKDSNDAFGGLVKSRGQGLGKSSGSSLGSVDQSGDVGSIDGLNTDNFQVKGGLSKEDVYRVVKANRRQLKNCYQRALITNKRLSGRVTLRWIISPVGPVLRVSKVTSTTQSNQLDSCVQGVVRRMMFPKAPNGQRTIVIYPFVFSAPR